MTKPKKSIVMHGTLLCPLVLGNCAFLRANGTTYRTSAVVAIHEQSADMIHLRRSIPTTTSRWTLSRWRPSSRLIRPWPRARRIQQVRGHAP